MKKYLRQVGKFVFAMIIGFLIVGTGFAFLFGVLTFLHWAFSFINSILGTVIAILLGLIVSGFVIAGIETWMENHNED